jgi:hypothetical protein
MKQEKPYLIAIPIPSLDRIGNAITKRKREKWIRIAQKELTQYFGGATAVPAPGTNIVEGKILYEQGQILVLAACGDRAEFMAKRRGIEALIQLMGAELKQDSVFLLAFSSDSVLIEMPKGTPP